MSTPNNHKHYQVDKPEHKPKLVKECVCPIAQTEKETAKAQQAV